MEITLLNLLATALVGFCGALYGVMGGGGALLTTPFLIFMGLPAKMAIGTTKMASMGFHTCALYKFHKGKAINYQLGWRLMAIGVIGEIIGANLVLQISDIWLKRIIAIFMLLVLILLMSKRRVGLTIIQTSRAKQLWGYVGIFFLSIYGGFFSGGGGIAANYLLAACFGLTFLQATATDKMSAWLPTAASLIVFVVNGSVNYVIGSAMLIGYSLGAYLGAGYALKKGSEFIKKIMIAAVLVFAVKLLFF